MKIDPNSVFRPGYYSVLPLEKLVKTHPHLAKRAHYVLERSGRRWRITVRGLGPGEHVSFVDSAGEANRARQALSDLGITGIVVGVLA